MKLFKLNVTGNMEEFNINYTASSNFIDYKDCGYAGSEQEKYSLFLEDLSKNGGPQPVNIKVKMTTQTTDRALSKNEVLSIKEVNDFIKRLGR
ncbi:hypothetical protein M2651_03065 [Clostridium sp. SYSU_GA19001]|uniref:hypothetical protein n=1 Tax=Clostridium caldaquaticum TaxID=2940653 RepID=UPI002077683C|nr:hypothetical protein [Clostridium caldaquaticum]MCM8710006.1 hypothetical protein [Clostridium caldaquaticum]